MTQWVNYKHIRENVKFVEVLAHYKIDLKIRGERASGFCPLPCHGGKGKSPSFSANVARGIWQCFGCKAKGNVIDFIAHMEKLDPLNSQDFRKAAIIAQERFLPGTVTPSQASKSKEPVKQPLASDKPVEVNGPLDFELKNLDPSHPYLSSRGFTAETIKHFGLGYCSKGFMNGRIVIPLHDQQARFIGYAGRVVDDSTITAENPKYRFPGKREHKGVVHEFRKSIFLYNGHAIQKPVSDLIVVEGFASVWWLWQHGFRSVVALMGSTCSEAQAELIVNSVEPMGRIWILPDGDEAGEKCGKGCVLALSRKRFVSWVVLEDQRQPTDCAPGELALLIPMGRQMT